MIRRSAALAALACAVMPLASCAPLEPISYSKARTPLERAEAAYTRIRIFGILAALALPAASRSGVLHWITRADQALAAARQARDLEQLHRLQDLARAAAMIEAGTVRVQPPSTAIAAPPR